MQLIERPPTPDITKEKRRFRRKFVASAIAGLAISVTGILGIDTALSKANDTPDRPTTSIPYPEVIMAPDPAQAAKVQEVDQALLEKCRESKFVVITFSGTGMETSHYQANMIQKFVEEMGGCVMYHWYGHTYDPEKSAQSVEDAIEEVTPKDERKQVMFFGASFGGIAAEDIASEPVIKDSKVIDLKKIIMNATPGDMNDVKLDLFGIPIPLIKDIPVEIPEFGGLVVLANAINGQRQRNQLGEPVAWKDTFINAAKTRPRLTYEQARRIRGGMLNFRTDVAVDYIGSGESDDTVDTERAYAGVDNVVVAPTRYIVIYDAEHDEGWLAQVGDKTDEAVYRILLETLGKPA